LIDALAVPRQGVVQREIIYALIAAGQYGIDDGPVIKRAAPRVTIIAMKIARKRADGIRRDILRIHAEALSFDDETAAADD
jgi:hypothetical protein